MKPIHILVLTAMTLSGAVASASPITRNTTLAATVVNVNDKIDQIDLYSSGTMLIHLRDKNEVIEHTLSEPVNQEAQSLAQAAGNAKITEKHQIIICMIALGPYQPFLEVSKFDFQAYQFDGEPHPVLSTLSCALHTEIFPSEQYELEYAQQLKELLIVVANEAIANR